jgi:hypothetical protein
LGGGGIGGGGAVAAPCDWVEGRPTVSWPPPMCSRAAVPIPMPLAGTQSSSLLVADVERLRCPAACQPHPPSHPDTLCWVENCMVKSMKSPAASGLLAKIGVWAGRGPGWTGGTSKATAREAYSKGGAEEGRRRRVAAGLNPVAPRGHMAAVAARSWPTRPLGARPEGLAQLLPLPPPACSQQGLKGVTWEAPCCTGCAHAPVGQNRTLV